jgi:NADH-quinone oxidoreductase subunit M
VDFVWQWSYAFEVFEVMLTLLWAIPVLGAVLTLLSSALNVRAQWVAVLLATMELWIVLGAGAGFWSGHFTSLVEAHGALVYGIHYSFFMDGLSWSLCLLNAFLTIIALLSAWKQDLSAGFWASFLFLEGAVMGVFLARDLFFFYIFWEAMLIPMFFIIGIWGSEGRKHAAIKFFLFTFFGSLFLLLGILALVVFHHNMSGVWSWDMSILKAPTSGFYAVAAFAAFVIGFGVKIPLVPIHTWLPDAHTEAPAAGSIILAGVLLKVGVYGFLRVLLPAFPEWGMKSLPWLGGLAAINVIYGALCAMVQVDLKRLIAYSSIAHLGFCVLGIASRTPQGLAGGSLQLINHGITTGALFLMVGFLYERTHKRGIFDFGELASQAPVLTFFFAFTVFASIGLPGLNGFIGEFMALSGMAHVSMPLAVIGVFGVTFAAFYLLPAFQSVFLSARLPNSVSSRVFDLDLRERALLWSLVILMLFIGLHPAPLLNIVGSAVGKLVL